MKSYLRKKYFIALDLGGTKIRAGLIDFKGKIIKITAKPTPKSKKKILKVLIEIIKKLDSPKVKAIGLGLAGQVNKEKGILVFTPNLPFKNFPIIKFLKKHFKKPVFIENDTHCFSLAEAILGQGKKYHYVVGITLGTGVGGGIIINRKIYSGVNNAAGEFGHITISDQYLFKCSCGQWDHLESLVSGPAMVKWYKKFTGQTKTTFEIAEELRRGEKTAKKVIQKMAEYLAIGISNIIAILNPEIIILGGGLAKIDELISGTLKRIKNKLPPSILNKTKIKKSKLGDKAGILGAYLIAKQGTRGVRPLGRNNI